jgi:hypothetical protein
MRARTDDTPCAARVRAPHDDALGIWFGDLYVLFLNGAKLLVKVARTRILDCLAHETAS